jgi:hypothetical protein
VRVRDDLFHEPIPVIAVGGSHSIPQCVGFNAFNFVVQVAPFLMKEALTICDQELHIPGLRMIDCGKVDFPVSAAAKNWSTLAVGCGPVGWLRSVVQLRNAALGVSRSSFFLRWTLSFFGAVCAIGPTLNLENDGSLHDAIEESHGHGSIGQILSPFFEVHVGGERRRTLLVPQSDDLIEQVSRLRAFLPLDFVAAEFVDDQ